MDSRLQYNHETRGALRTEYEDDDKRAETIHESVPPDCAHAPPHDAVADDELWIPYRARVSGSSRSEGGGRFRARN